MHTLKTGKRRLLLLLAIVVRTVLACGDSGSTATDAGGDVNPAACPAEAPAGGGSCSPSGLRCSYYCGITATCTCGSWGIGEVPCSQPHPEAGADASLDAPAMDSGASCPAAQPTGSNGGPTGFYESVCASQGANCNYSATCCDCAPTPSCGGQALWWCGQTNAPAPCPATLPSTGDTCSSGTTECRYCTPQGYFQASCSAGSFVVGPVVEGCYG
jgi:hypothetical protein